MWSKPCLEIVGADPNDIEIGGIRSASILSEIGGNFAG